MDLQKLLDRAIMDAEMRENPSLRGDIWDMILTWKSMDAGKSLLMI